MYAIVVRVSLSLIITASAVSGAIKCHMWRELLPCECRVTKPQTRTTSVTCENMASFGQVIDIMRGHFHPNDKINLRLERSNLHDLQYRQFREINVTIESIKLNHDYLGYLNDETFSGMSRVTYLSLADTPIEKIPGHLWKNMPHVQTTDLGRAKIREILYDSFNDLQEIRTIVLPGNQISRIDRNSIPIQTERLHLGRNRIYHLNDTLTGLTSLSWLFLNANDFEDLEGQLPYEAPNLKMIHASNNRLIRVPQQMSLYPRLDTLFLSYNQITSLDGAISGCKALERIDLEANQIHTLTTDDFLELGTLDTLVLAHNQITTLNNSLILLKNLDFLNASYNLLTEFSFNEILGLERLRRIDLSYNQIANLVGPASNLVEPNIKLTELKLDHNNLETLNAALSGLSELLRLDLSYNKIRRISPDDFINLDQLRLLDISHNQLKTLEDMSKTYLPRLSELKATHNHLTIMEHDFHGLPVLCDADLSSNQIVALGRELVTKTRCKIEHGVHEGTWDTLKIYLTDNPILCDAALPEITSEMETNHTKVIGVSYCPPLSEQPITPRPNAYLGYIPEQATPALPPVLPPVYGQTSFETPSVPVLHTNLEPLETPNQIQPKIHPEVRDPNLSHNPNDQYHTVEHFEGVEIVRKSATLEEPIAVTLHKPSATPNGTQQDPTPNQVNLTSPVFDPIVQGQVITKLASEIEELRTRIDEISAQNERLLNKTILEQSNVTTKVP